VAWVQYQNGTFRTTDGAKSWHEITDAKPSTFGFAVAVHPEEPDTAWLVPAVNDEKRIPVDGRLIVSRTIDGGRTFEVLREGLPQQHACDLVLRHAQDVHTSARRSPFGSTTESLWIDEHGGESWPPVTHHAADPHQSSLLSLAAMVRSTSRWQGERRPTPLDLRIGPSASGELSKRQSDASG